MFPRLLNTPENSHACYRSGSLVFGGGHVILPLLQAEVMPMSWINNASFLAGINAAVVGACCWQRSISRYGSTQYTSRRTSGWHWSH
ncbi:chromate transporter [Nitrosomonas halophila]|jgi:hypothetical protein|uniref:Chromate transporter n=1 Tax=Nitrosomonas halophila TaxID=44576 RepID=A0A1H3EE70_9PROT|nr:Chromate transporter [Nitrosomonas halophila]